MLSEKSSPGNTLNRNINNVTSALGLLTSPRSLPSPFHVKHLPPSSDNAQDVDVSSKRKINKQKSSSSSERLDSPKEIAAGNCLVAKEEKSDGKIDTQKKRFFDLRRTVESASNKISSISPSRFAVNLTPRLRRKSSTNHKLSQLEQQSNLFIRDGAESITNKQDDALMRISMESADKPHQTIKIEVEEPKRSSLIPSFNFQIQSTIAKKNDETTKSIFCKTGKKFKIFCKNFSPEAKHKSPTILHSVNYKEIDIHNEDEGDESNVDRERQNMITNAPDVLNDNDKSNCTKTESSSPKAIICKSTIEQPNFEKFSSSDRTQKTVDEEEEEFNSIESCGEAVSKPAYSSGLFENIPIRPRM